MVDYNVMSFHEKKVFILAGDTHSRNSSTKRYIFLSFSVESASPDQTADASNLDCIKIITHEEWKQNLLLKNTWQKNLLYS